MTNFFEASSPGDTANHFKQSASTTPLSYSIGLPRREKLNQARRKFTASAKRTSDILFSLAGLAMLAPLLLAVAAAIRLDSKGPVLFSQARWGKDMRRIRVYKFRTMRTDMCDTSGVKQTVADDPRITRLGKFLRKSNIDELPQLINVLRGDMSIVGPRCHPIGMLAAGVPYEELVDNYHDRHKVRPGITGLAQMKGLRGPTVQAHKARARIAMDVYYIENQSLWLDVKILAGTFRNEFLKSSGF